MIYATAFGANFLGVVDTFINQIAILIGVVAECIVFAWIFNAEKLIKFLNYRSKSLKLNKWWLVIVKYILPIFVSIIWIGGMVDVINNGAADQLILTFVVAAILLVTTLIFTILPPKSDEWYKTDDRI